MISYSDLSGQTTKYGNFVYMKLPTFFEYKRFLFSFKILSDLFVHRSKHVRSESMQKRRPVPGI